MDPVAPSIAQQAEAASEQVLGGKGLQQLTLLPQPAPLLLEQPPGMEGEQQCPLLLQPLPRRLQPQGHQLVEVGPAAAKLLQGRDPVAQERHHGGGWRGGTVIGHLLECAGQLTGGYFADPGLKDVRDLAHLGFPFCDVDADCAAGLTCADAGGGFGICE